MSTETIIIITQSIMAASAAFIVLITAFAVVPWLKRIRDDLNATQKTLTVIQTFQATRKDNPGVTGSTKAQKTEDPELARVTSERDRLSLALAQVIDAEYPPPPQYTAWAQSSYTEGVNTVLTRLRATLQQ